MIFVQKKQSHFFLELKQIINELNIIVTIKKILNTTFNKLNIFFGNSPFNFPCFFSSFKKME